MNPIEILKFMGEQGARYKPSQLGLILSYLDAMIQDKRIIIIYEENQPYAFMAFSICNDMVQYLKKDLWAYLPHDPHGRTIYIEKLVSKSWNRELRLKFEEEILKLYPQLEKGIWHRYAKWGDRQTYTVRRNKECMKSRS